MQIKRMELCSKLWASGIKAEFGFKPNPKMGDQLGYALEQGIPYMVCYFLIATSWKRQRHNRALQPVLSQQWQLIWIGLSACALQFKTTYWKFWRFPAVPNLPGRPLDTSVVEYI